MRQYGAQQHTRPGARRTSHERDDIPTLADLPDELTEQDRQAALARLQHEASTGRLYWYHPAGRAEFYNIWVEAQGATPGRRYTLAEWATTCFPTLEAEAADTALAHTPTSADCTQRPSLARRMYVRLLALFTRGRATR